MRQPLSPPMQAAAQGVVTAAEGLTPRDAAAALRWHARADDDFHADAFSDLAARHYGRALAALAARDDEPVSLALAVPFCAAHCLCCARPVHAAQPADVIDAYVDGLVDEMRTVAGCGVGGRDVLQLHLGGGTANELGDLELLRLMKAVRTLWRVPADAELSVDYDPRRAGWSQLQLLRSLGFRRVTFGVLDLDPIVQRAIGRLQSAALIEDVCNLARTCGVDLITLDLMIGLPGQTEQRWRATLQHIVDIAPDRINVMRYRHQPWNAPTQFAIDADALPEADELRALAAQAVDTLGAAGYRRVGPDHWVLDTDELSTLAGWPRRSLISYTVTPDTAVFGLGAGAVGRVDGDTFHNVASLPLWRQAVAAGVLPVAHVQWVGAQAGVATDASAVDGAPRPPSLSQGAAQ